MYAFIIAAWLVLAGLAPVPPLWKLASGSIMDMHVHGRPGRIGTTYHVLIDDSATGRIYTCSVPRANYDDLRYSRPYGTACWGRRGRL